MKNYIVARISDGPTGTKVVAGVIVLDNSHWSAGYYYVRPITHVVLHSPTGFECGYAGSGPADLAVSILADFYDVPASIVEARWQDTFWISKHPGEENVEFNRKAELAIAMHQSFKARFLGEQLAPGECFVLRESLLREWIAAHQAEIAKSAEV